VSAPVTEVPSGRAAPASEEETPARRREGETLLPFCFLKVRKGTGYHMLNPVDNREYVVDYAEYRILEQCDGTRTPEEIAGSVEAALGMTKAAAAGYTAAFLDKMRRAGIVAFRRSPVRYEPGCPPPFVVYWDVTAACNLRCSHCYCPGCEPCRNELSTEVVRRTLEEMSAFGVKWVVFSGGEPLLRKDFLEIAAHARGLRFEYLSVATNGTLIDRDTARRLKALDLDVQVSIDGDNAETHDLMRGVKGAFDQAIRGLKLLQEEGMDVSVCTVAARSNVDRIPNILQLMRDLGVQHYRVQAVMPMGRGRTNSKDLRLSPARLKELVQYLDSRNISASSYEFTLKPPPKQAVDYCQNGACAAATSKCAITAEGNVVPCTPFWGMNGENVRDHTFPWIWERSPLLNYFRSITLNDIRGVCRDCKWLMLCNGGCKVDNYVDGDLFGSNGDCWIAHEMRLAAASSKEGSGEF